MELKIIKAVRKIQKDIHLHIVGGCSNKENAYIRKIKNKISENDEWITWHKNLNRKEMVELVSKHKYGIHGMKNEHFGIAVAELVSAGCIPFIPDSGGQVEIVKDNKLTYSSIPDAIEKIQLVINNYKLQIELRDKLNKVDFSADIFKQKILDIVNRYLDK